MSNGNRRTDLRRGSIDLKQLVSDPDTMINAEGKLSIPQGSMTNDQLAVLEKLVVAMQSPDDRTWANLTHLVRFLKGEQIEEPGVIGLLNVLTSDSEIGYDLQLGTETKPLYNIVTNTIKVLEENSIYLAGLKLSVVDGNIVVKNEQDETLAVLNDVIAEENIKTAILSDDTPAGLIQQVVSQVPAGVDGKSAFQIWQESDPANSSLTEQDFLLSLKGDTGIQGLQGLPGADGTNGLSAYESWIAEGNTGTQQDFLNAIIGPQGPQGEQGSPGVDGANGVDGLDGAQGLSAYEVWLSQGNTGSQADFLTSLIGEQGLKGDKGDQGDVGPAGQDGAIGPQGPIGLTGDDGADGLSAYQIWLNLGNSGSESEFISSLTGPKGDTGDQGLQGLPGADGLDGQNGTDGISAYQTWLSLGNTGTEQDFITALTGPKGDQGDTGLTGPQGIPGQDGAPGVNGQDGQNGDSAYQIWLNSGNTGSETEFLASLIGPQGEEGQPGLNGTNGTDGSDGLSAYQIWVSQGNTGSETEFLASLTGATGDQGPTGPAGPTGPQGEQGEPGQDFDPTLHISDTTTTTTTLWSSQKTQTEINSAVSSYVETDPVFLASPAASITASSITNWNTSYSWGDHSQAGYLTSETPETVTSIALNANQLSYTDENGSVTSIDLSVYLDDSNLARVISGTYNSSNQELVFTRDDASTFTIDASMFFDDTNLVTSVNGSTGAVSITVATLGLQNVNNTSDLDKPVSTATQSALDLKLDATSLPTTLGSFTNDVGFITDYTVTQSDVTAHQAALSITESQISDLGSYEPADSNIVKDSAYVHIDVTSSSVTDGTNTFDKYLDSEAREAIGSITMDMTGFPSRDATTLTFDPTSRRLTLAPVSTSFTLWYRGQEIVISSPLTIDITDNDGGRYIKYNPQTSSLEELAIGAHPSLLSDLLVSYIFWDSVNSKAVIFGDERHSSHRDTQWHLSQHLDVGAIWRSGGALGYQLENVNDVTLTLGDITIADEDLVHVIQNGNAANPYKQVLDGDAEIPVVYKNGTLVTQTAAASVPWVADAVSISYNEIVNDNGSLATVSNGNYISYYLVATNDSAYPIKLMMGHQQYSTAAAAEAEEFINLGFPVPELVPLYKITLQAKTSGPYKCQIHSVAQLSGRQSSLNAAFSATSHDALTERSLTDQHPISAITGLQAALDSKEAADATILKDADIGVNVQAYDVNIVSDANYVHTDNNYDSAAVSKLAGIDTGATDDQTAEEIVAAIDASLAAEETLKSALSLGSAAYTASTDYATPADISSLNASISLKADQTSLDSTNSNLSTLQTSVSANSNSIATLDSSLSTAQSDISTLETTATSLQTQITSNDSDISSLDTRLTATETAVTGNDSDISGLDTRLTAVEGNVTTLQSNVSSNDSDIASLQSNVATAQTDITTLQGNVSSNDTDIASLDTRLTSAEANITSNDSDISNLNTDVSALDTRLTTAESNISSNDTDIAGLDTRLTAAEANIASNDGDITALQTAVSGNDADILAIQGNVSTLQSDLDTAEATIISLQSQISSNDTDITALDGRLTTAEADILSNAGGISTNASSIATNASGISTNSTAISSLDTRLTATENEIDTLQSEMDSAEARLASNEALLATHQSSVGLESDGSYQPISGNYATDSNIKSAVESLDTQVKVNSDRLVDLEVRDGGLFAEDSSSVIFPETLTISGHLGPFKIDLAQLVSNNGAGDIIFFGTTSKRHEDRHFKILVDGDSRETIFTGTTI